MVKRFVTGVLLFAAVTFAFVSCEGINPPPTIERVDKADTFQEDAVASDVSNTVQAAARLSGFKILAYEWNRVVFQLPDEVPDNFHVRVRIYHHSRSAGHDVGYGHSVIIPPSAFSGNRGQLNIKNHWNGSTDQEKMLDYTVAYTSAYISGSVDRVRWNYNAPRKARTRICPFHWGEKNLSVDDREYPKTIRFQTLDFGNGPEFMASWGYVSSKHNVLVGWGVGGPPQVSEYSAPASRYYDLASTDSNVFGIRVSNTWRDYTGANQTCHRDQKVLTPNFQ